MTKTPHENICSNVSEHKSINIMWHCVKKKRGVVSQEASHTSPVKAVASKFAFGALADSYYECPACASCLTCPKFSLHLCPGLFNKDLYKLQITLAFLIGIFWSSGFNIPPKRSSRSKSLVPACGRNSSKQWHVWCIYSPTYLIDQKLSVTGGSRSQKKLKWWSRCVEGCLEADFFFLIS